MNRDEGPDVAQLVMAMAQLHGLGVKSLQNDEAVARVTIQPGFAGATSFAGQCLSGEVIADKLGFALRSSGDKFVALQGSDSRAVVVITLETLMELLQ